MNKVFIALLLSVLVLAAGCTQGGGGTGGATGIADNDINSIGNDVNGLGNDLGVGSDADAIDVSGVDTAFGS